ncbi:hypothetical protein BC941DRAFT_139111 [Chlamydoabsidia padenii]|nr:hypothetical protein BC941DRAFT_139111 [Chlamydoabsidia padenii]
MLTTFSQEVQAAVYVEWVNACPAISHPCNDITELSSGALLLEVLSEIDSTWFKPIPSADVGDQWLLKHSNLKRLITMISRYYEQVLGIPFDKLPQVDLTDIAKFANVQELFKLCQLVLYITVASENNALAVRRLQQLPQQSQGVVMHCIEQIDSIRSASSSGTYVHNSPRSSLNDDAIYRNQNDTSRMVLEKEELETTHRKLIEDHAQLRYRYDELETEKADLQLRLQEMDKAVTQANETGRTDFIMRTEIEHLKQDFNIFLFYVFNL